MNLALIQLARLRPLTLRRQLRRADGTRYRPQVAAYMQRAVLMAIAVETGNGAHPMSRDRLADAAGIEVGYMGDVVDALVVAGLVSLGKLKRWDAGNVRCRQLVVDAEKLEKMSKGRGPRPLKHVADAAGLAQGLVDATLLEMRDGVLKGLGLCVDDVKPQPGAAKAGMRKSKDDRVLNRGRVCWLLKASWRRNTKTGLCTNVLGQVMGCNHASVRWALRRWEERMGKVVDGGQGNGESAIGNGRGGVA